MKTATVHEIKKELGNLSQSELIELAMRLVKYKKESKELMTYLLFEAHNEQAYIESIKEEIVEQFRSLNKDNLYLAKKTIRKVLRTTNKYIKYSGNKLSEIELLIFFCETLKNSGIRLHRNTVLLNLYQNQVKKIEKALDKLHEDIRFDFRDSLSSLDIG